jgi:hypothetical protein
LTDLLRITQPIVKSSNFIVMSWNDYISESSVDGESSKYSSIMTFLDEATENEAKSPSRSPKHSTQKNHSPKFKQSSPVRMDLGSGLEEMSALDDDVSALSFSPSRAHSSIRGTGTRHEMGMNKTKSIKKRNNYIWDEFSDTGGKVDDDDDVTNLPTYFSTHSHTTSLAGLDIPLSAPSSVRTLDAQTAAPSSSHQTLSGAIDTSLLSSSTRGNRNNVNGTSSIETTVTELMTKLTMMKNELKQKNSVMKDLQTEYKRLMIACKRRTEKSTEKWQSKLNTEIDTHKNVTKSQKEFLNKIDKDINALIIKRNNIQDQVETSNSRCQTILDGYVVSMYICVWYPLTRFSNNNMLIKCFLFFII